MTSLPAGICAVDTRGRIRHTTPAIERIFGPNHGQHPDRPLSSYLEEAIVDPAQALAWLVALSEALNDRQTTYLNLPTAFRAGFDDGPCASVIGVVTPWIDEAGGQLGALLVFSDSAHFHDLEGVRSRFLSVISHELRSPVSNIVAAADQMARYFDRDVVPLWRLLGIVQAELARLQRLLGSFLSPPSGGMERPAVRHDVVALRPLIRRTAHIFRVRKTGHQIAVQVPPDLPFARGDADGIQQILSNLVDNALKYTPPGGQITLQAATEPGGIVVRVADQGAGVPEDQRQHLFSFASPSGQVPGSVEDPAGSSADPPGSTADPAVSADSRGLGLPIAKNLVEAMGGEMWYEESASGEPAFCFRLLPADDLNEGENEK
ncbi:MAG: ATP-binding protein [Anaerolineae bacterium]